MNGVTDSLPVLSICLPTFNRAPYLDCLLRDLCTNIKDLGFSYELVIGDNASDDETPDVVSRYADQLSIRYIRRPENLGSGRNVTRLIAEAQGRYVTVLADDDFLIPAALGRCLVHMEDNPGVGAVFAPWLIYDRIAALDVDQFYALDKETHISVGDHGALFDLLVKNHVFPESYVARTHLARSAASADHPFAFKFFVQISLLLDQAGITFRTEPYYRSVSRYFEHESRSQAGHEEVKSAWDRYRGGLEYILAKVAHRLDVENLVWCRRAIEHFVDVRMHVALRLRTIEGKNWVDNYYIANRLRCVGNDSLLPAPYEAYRVNAALDYLLSLDPFYPEPSTIVYYLDDPPIFLTRANDFNNAGLIARADRSLPLLVNTILLTNREPAVSHGAVFAVSEAELLAKFP